MMTLPRALKPGDAVAVVSPSGPVNRDGVLRGISFIEESGFQVEFKPTLFERHGYLAGEDASRVNELNFFIRRNDIAAIVCARGGYGATRLLPHVDVDTFCAHPKILVGFSDITALHLLFGRAGCLTFHGPTVDLAGHEAPDEWSQAQLWRALTQTRPLGEVEQPPGAPPLHVIAPGTATGRLYGGNLSLICSSMGTPYELDFGGRIILLEDVGESPYRIDRYLTQLRLAGQLQRAAGIAFGESINCEADPGRPSFSLVEVLTDRLGDLGIPVVYGFSLGHGRHRGTVPLGVMAQLSGDTGQLVLTEPALRE